MLRALVAGGLLTWWAMATAAYLPVWDSPVTLAAHAARRAPQKPRPLILFGVMLTLQGKLAEAQTVFLAARDAASAPHVPFYDRERAMDAVSDNLRAVATLEARTREMAWPVFATR